MRVGLIFWASWLAFWSGGVLATGQGKPAVAIRIAALLEMPPYVIEEGSRGLELDIIRAAFQEVGREVSFTHIPQGRMEALVRDKMFDGVAVVLNNSDCHLSATYSVLQDGLAVRKDKQENISRIADLAGYRLGSFPGSDQIYADHLSGVKDRLAAFITVQRSILAVRMLEHNRIDAYLGDYIALQYIHDIAEGHSAAERPFVIVQKLEPFEQKICFLNAGTRDIFNAGLESLKKHPLYDELHRKYLP